MVPFPSHEFAVTYKLDVESFSPFSRMSAAYYNVTVTFYAARNSDTTRHRASAEGGIGFHRGGGCIRTSGYYRSGWLVYATSRWKRAFVPYDWKRLWRVRAIYANHSARMVASNLLPQHPPSVRIDVRVKIHPAHLIHQTHSHAEHK